MKEELKYSANRHASRLIAKITEVMDIPAIVEDAIRKEVEYATMDGYRITAKNRNGESENDILSEIRG